MRKNTFSTPKAHTVACLFTVGLSFSALAIDHHCVERHELCPDQYKKTTYAPDYQDMLKNKPAPVVAPVAKASPLDSDKDGVLDSADKCPDTPKGYKVDANGCPKSVTLHINFPFASNVIPASSETEVQTLMEFMQENPAATVSIVGHTDNNGIDARNQPRSEARAKALADKLIASGISADRIKTSGKGSKQPIASNATDAGRAKNRRIEVAIK